MAMLMECWPIVRVRLASAAIRACPGAVFVHHRRHGTTKQAGVGTPPAELEAQIARLNAALQQWRGTRDHLQPMDAPRCCGSRLRRAKRGPQPASGTRWQWRSGAPTGWNEVETATARCVIASSGTRTSSSGWATFCSTYEEPRQLHADSLRSIRPPSRRRVGRAGGCHLGHCMDNSRDARSELHRNGRQLRGPSSQPCSGEVTRLA